MARAVATHMPRDREAQPVRPDWVFTGWANVNGPGDSNFCHYHPGSFWSGTYYVDDGGAAGIEQAGGGFEMLDPRGPAAAMLAPALGFAGEGGTAAGMTETIEPRPGLLVLFPSWLQHHPGCSTRCVPTAARRCAYPWPSTGGRDGYSMTSASGRSPPSDSSVCQAPDSS